MKHAQSRIAFASPLFLILMSGAVSGLGSEKDHASWWIETYGLADSANTKFMDRAEAIFSRVAAAADKRANRLPTLVVLNAKGSPFAMALPDGSVLLTKGALQICYEGQPLALGDSRLAFVLGHELAHLGNDDFWHAAAFEALEQHATANEAEDQLRVLMRQSPDDARRREFHADAYGMLYMTIAGFDPNVLFGGESFFGDWAAQLMRLGLRIVGEQSTPSERAAMAKSQASAIASEMDFYRFGVRLIQIGRYQDGLLLLEHFRDRFPSREVLNNLGYAHFQLAAHLLGECDGRLIVRFKVPMMIDPTTRASRLRSAGGVSPCFEQRNIKRHLQEAERNFEEAVAMDPKYLPARLNLFSVHAIAGRGAQALVVAEGALEVDDGDRRARGARAVALYLYGEQSGLATADSAIEQLEAMEREGEGDSTTAYNRASMLSERRRVQAARDAYSGYLKLEPTGIFSDAARDYLGDGSERHPEGSRNKRSTPAPPLDLGRLSRAEVRSRFPDARLADFSVGSFSGAFIHFPGGQALAIADTIEFVEERVKPPLPEQATVAKYGEVTTLVDAMAEKIFIYEGFGLVSRVEGVVAHLYFAE
jgi:tetratricopeptide (TPR) repeat protein